MATVLFGNSVLFMLNFEQHILNVVFTEPYFSNLALGFAVYWKDLKLEIH